MNKPARRIVPQPLRFPKNFVWGTATAAAQIEGGAFEDGKGWSVWDTYARQPGKVHNGDTLDTACDHYHRYPGDFALMAKMGIKNYRLSVSWPRLFPAGTGARNEKGFAFYHRLFDAMEKHGITPWVTLFHWDLPQALEDQGGWRVRSTADAFAPYAEAVVKAYGDRVKNWITLNEIICFTRFGYGGHDKAPGLDLGEKVVNQTYHHALLCHGHGVAAVRAHGGRGARVGITDNSFIGVPVTETAADIEAAKKLFVSENTRILEPIYRGRYHPAYLRAAGKDRPVVEKGDLAHISRPTDFLGLNIYTGAFCRAGKGGKAEILPFPASYPQTNSPWHSLLPQVLYWGPRLAAEVYGAGVPAIYITENGAGYDDAPPVNGEVIDLHRREHVRNCLSELRRAIGDGVPVKGYFLWSFLDNFEWQDGYNRRFGIVYNDFVTQRRTPKLSARWYSQVIAANALV